MKKAKKRISAQKYILACPKCGSIDVGADFSNPVVWSYGSTVQHRCHACGHLAHTFPEVREDKIKDFVKRLPKRKAENEPLIDVKTGYDAFRLELFGLCGAAGLALILFSIWLSSAGLLLVGAILLLAAVFIYIFSRRMA